MEFGHQLTNAIRSELKGNYVSDVHNCVYFGPFLANTPSKLMIRMTLKGNVEECFDVQKRIRGCTASNGEVRRSTRMKRDRQMLSDFFGRESVQRDRREILIETCTHGIRMTRLLCTMFDFQLAGVSKASSVSGASILKVSTRFQTWLEGCFFSLLSFNPTTLSLSHTHDNNNNTYDALETTSRRNG